MAPYREKLKILFASRLVHEKGIDILIDAIEASMHDPSLKEGLEWHICSDGRLEDAIRVLVQKYSEHVKYYGKVDTPRLRDLYQEADFLLMPSRFLEMFGLTALESLACGTPVIGIKKGGLTSFIPEYLALDEEKPIGSLLDILRNSQNTKIPHPIDIALFDKRLWIERLNTLFEGKERILLLHDYSDLIGGAEYYLDFVKRSLLSLGKQVDFFGYHEKTTSWKRRIIFMTSLFAFWRGCQLKRKLQNFEPDAIWMHSVLRYIGVWGVHEVTRFAYERNIPTYLSHHDVGLMAAFPQHITQEEEIPSNPSLSAFIPQKLSLFHRFISIWKWCYVALLKLLLPRNVKHIIFSAFLERHIHANFPSQEVVLFPHAVDRDVFHP